MFRQPPMGDRMSTDSAPSTLSESLIKGPKRSSQPIMTNISNDLFDICDRTRLGERFFGATHTVLARL